RRRRQPDLRLRHRRIALPLHRRQLHQLRLRAVVHDEPPGLQCGNASVTAPRLPPARTTVTVEGRMEDPSAAQVLARKYRLVHQLGKGGMGSVWLAHPLTLQSPVAIKLIEPQIAANPEALTRFMREARAAAALRSPHVVQILDHGVDEGTPYI